MSLDFQLADRQLKQTTKGDVYEITTVGGSMFASDGRIWVRKPGGFDDGGTTITNLPILVDNIAPLVTQVGRLVYVGEGLDGNLIIKGNVATDLRQAGINQRQLNPNDPSVKFKLIEHLSNLQSFPTGGDGTVMVHPAIYRKPDGDYGIFSGQASIDLLTSYTPATSTNQLVVALWLDPNDNTISITSSSEVSQSTDLKANPTTALTYLAECVAAAPAQGIGVWSYIIRGDDTVISEQNKFHDLRGIIGSGSTNIGGYFPIDVTTTVSIAANTQIVTDEYTISTGGSVIVDGRITVI